ncbi:reticuline oxidase-like [Papaver somniferum]|uniref:reticuline oxidase-like n=1 Tax=Papaver somniferum TaxID=3469 RepID=UPI000E6F8D1E|nr:reticuline oxidase-like [Papaver somniferum]
MAMKSMLNHYSLFIFLLMSLVVPFLSEPTNIISSCLTQNQVKNFTLNANSGNDTSEFHKLLSFSIQNLRYAESTYTKPIVIVLPDTKEQLANTVLCSKQASLAIRVRCGGHSYEGLSSVSTNSGELFMIIDVMNLNNVSVDLESETAWVEGGATLGETYQAIAESSHLHGFSAGSCPTVGSGGHISGGGFGLLSRKYGLAADNVVDAILIDANGRFVDRKAMGEDVFWAIRGGGGGVWGIIYAWKVQLVPVPETVTSFILSRSGTQNSVAKLVQKWQFVAPNLEDEFYLSVFVGAGLPETRYTGISATFKGFYLGSTAEAISTLNREFPELGVAEDDCKEMSWIESVVFFSGLRNGSTVLDLKNRYLDDKGYFKAKSDYVKEPISMRGIKTALRILENEPKGYVILDPYGGIMSKISSDSIPFPHRAGNIFAIQYLVAWNSTENSKNDVFISWIRNFYNSMTNYVAKGPRTAYVNYLDLDLGQVNLLSLTRSTTMARSQSDAVKIAKVWGEKYFLKNYDRLVQAKTLIDPDNVFYNQQGIPPLSTSRLHSNI